MNNTMTRRETRDPFDTMFERFFGAPGTNGAACCSPQEGLLPVDVSETDTQVIVRAAAPGFKKEAIDDELPETVLTIRAQSREEQVETSERYFRRELRTGTLSRRIALSEGVSNQDIKAELTDGILTLRLNKVQKEQPRKITIG